MYARAHTHTQAYQFCHLAWARMISFSTICKMGTTPTLHIYCDSVSSVWVHGRHSMNDSCFCHFRGEVGGSNYVPVLDWSPCPFHSFFICKMRTSGEMVFKASFNFNNDVPRIAFLFNLTQTSFESS